MLSPLTSAQLCCLRRALPRCLASRCAILRHAHAALSGIYCFALFVGAAILLSWVMYLIAR